MNPLKKSKIITGVSFGVVGLLLAASITAFTKMPAKASDSGQETGNVSIKLDKNVYNGLMGMINHYAKDDDNDNDNQFVTKGNQLYVVIEGNAYPVVETEDGLVVSEGDNDPDHIIGTEDADGHDIIAVAEDGSPIIGYDKSGDPIYGKLVGDVPIQDALDIDNPRVSVDENGNRWYHIVWGDTLCDISSDIHYSVDELAEYNHIRNTNLIYAESDLRLPNGEWTEAPTDEATPPESYDDSTESAPTEDATEETVEESTEESTEGFTEESTESTESAESTESTDSIEE